MHVNKLLLRFRLSDESMMTLLVSRCDCCPELNFFCPVCIGSMVQWRDGVGNPPNQEQRSLRAV